MICTSRFSFIHLHKAAGQSINDALMKCIPDAREIGYHYPISILPASAASLPIIGVVRNPWDWYVSWYAFNNLRGVRNPLFNIVSKGKQLGFKETITRLIHYPDSSEVSQLSRRIHQSLLLDEFTDDRGAGFTKRCVDQMKSDSDGYYTTLLERMFGVDRPQLILIRFEKLVDEFCAALEHLGVEESEAVKAYLREQPSVNASRRSHYSHYYDHELSELVRIKEQRPLGRFCYEFEQAPAHEPRINIDALHRVPKLAGKAANFLEIGETVEIEPLATALRELPEAVWAESDRQTVFDVHRATQTIQLLSDDMSHTPPIRGRLYSMFEPLIQPILNQLTNQFGPDGTFIRILFAKLEPNSQIRPHVDSGYSLINCRRIHIPIITRPEVVFTVGGESRHLAEGEAWEINNANVHAVRNDSKLGRVHLIIDWTPKRTLLREKKPYRMDLPMFYSRKYRLAS